MSLDKADLMLERLQLRRKTLLEKLLNVAGDVADGGGADALTHLVRLKADIEAIDFAINAAP